MKSLADWKARWQANEKACISRQVAFHKLTKEQREAAIEHLQEMQPGRTRTFWAEEILAAHEKTGAR